MLKHLFAFVIHTTSLLDYLDIFQIRTLKFNGNDFAVLNFGNAHFKDGTVQRGVGDHLKKIRTSFSELGKITCLKLISSEQVLSPVKQLDRLESSYNFLQCIFHATSQKMLDLCVIRKTSVFEIACKCPRNGYFAIISSHKPAQSKFILYAGQKHLMPKTLKNLEKLNIRHTRLKIVVYFGIW